LKVDEAQHGNNPQLFIPLSFGLSKFCFAFERKKKTNLKGLSIGWIFLFHLFLFSPFHTAKREKKKKYKLKLFERIKFLLGKEFLSSGFESLDHFLSAFFSF
jgi:hypothetical protein